MTAKGTTKGLRLHIGIFGRVNSGKSSLINAITGQDLALVSAQAGTTTDPVYKAMELLPLGPVTLIDTPGLDDLSELGSLRIKKTQQVLNKCDLALLVIDCREDITFDDKELLEKFNDKEIPYLIVYNKIDLFEAEKLTFIDEQKSIAVSSLSGENIDELKNKLARLVPEKKEERKIIADLLQEGDLLVLVTPIDDAAPKDRLILPQQQTIREILEAKAMAIVVQDTELKDLWGKLACKPRMVITDSQAFKKVDADTPQDIELTSFSILFARFKGDLELNVKNVTTISKLQNGDKLLIAEACTHHRQCNDIGSVMLPGMIKKFTGKELDFAFCSGGEFPEDLSEYKMIVHCGGCMINEREMKHRQKSATEQIIPISNYGLLIAYMNGILQRSLKPFPEIYKLLEKQ